MSGYGWRNTVVFGSIYIYIYIYISNVSIDWYMREKQRGMISSNSRSQTVPKLILLIETM